MSIRLSSVVSSSSSDPSLSPPGAFSSSSSFSSSSISLKRKSPGSADFPPSSSVLPSIASTAGSSSSSSSPPAPADESMTDDEIEEADRNGHTAFSPSSSLSPAAAFGAAKPKWRAAALAFAEKLDLQQRLIDSAPSSSSFASSGNVNLHEEFSKLIQLILQAELPGAAAAAPVRDSLLSEISRALLSVGDISLLQPRLKHTLHILPDSLIFSPPASSAASSSFSVAFSALSHVFFVEDFQKKDFLIGLHLSPPHFIPAGKQRLSILILKCSLTLKCRAEQIVTHDPLKEVNWYSYSTLVQELTERTKTPFGKAKKTHTALLYKVLCDLLTQHPAFPAAKIEAMDSAVFLSSTNRAAVSAYLNTNDGLLFPLKSGVFFYGRPVLFLPISAIESITAGRTTSNRSFDLIFHMAKKETKVNGSRKGTVNDEEDEEDESSGDTHSFLIHSSQESVPFQNYVNFVRQQQKKLEKNPNGLVVVTPPDSLTSLAKQFHLPSVMEDSSTEDESDEEKQEKKKLGKSLQDDNNVRASSSSSSSSSSSFSSSSSQSRNPNGRPARKAAKAVEKSSKQQQFNEDEEDDEEDDDFQPDESSDEEEGDSAEEEEVDENEDDADVDAPGSKTSASKHAADDATDDEGEEEESAGEESLKPKVKRMKVGQSPDHENESGADAENAEDDRQENEAEENENDGDGEEERNENEQEEDDGDGRNEGSVNVKESADMSEFRVESVDEEDEEDDEDDEEEEQQEEAEVTEKVQNGGGNEHENDMDEDDGFDMP